VDVFGFLKLYPPFSELPEAELEKVARSLEIAHYPAGEVILRQEGQPAEALHIVRKGAVELLDDGVVLDLLGEGEVFGQFSLLAHDSPRVTVRAHEDSLCYLIPEPKAGQLLRSAPGMSFVLASMRQRLRAVAEQAGHEAGDPRYRTVTSLVRRSPVTADPATTIAEAAQLMTDQRVSSLLIPGPDGWRIVTDRDLRARVVAARGDIDRPVTEVASFPVHTIPSTTLSGDALTEMLARGVHHLPVVEGREIVGVITDTDLMGLGRHTPFALKSAIRRAGDASAVADVGRELPLVVADLVEASMDPMDVGRVVALVVDALTERLIELAVAEQGDPPVPFAWLELGAAARHEQALKTDQDHALAFDPEGASPSECEEYFGNLAEAVAAGLESAGIPRCKGDAMATHPAMRRPLPEWTARFRGWVNQPWADSSVLSSIGFDFRQVAGALDAEPAMNAAVLEARAHPAFLRLLARLATTLKPPTGFFGNLVVEAEGEHAGRLDVKHGGITIITSLARAWGIMAGSSAKGTRARLQAAADTGILEGTEASELTDAFRFLWEIRLRHQAAMVRAGEPPDDFVDPSGLGAVERGGLKEAFRVITGAQRRLAAEVGLEPR
jgi:CBS domain-containing protein